MRHKHNEIITLRASGRNFSYFNNISGLIENCYFGGNVAISPKFLLGSSTTANPSTYTQVCVYWHPISVACAFDNISR